MQAQDVQVAAEPEEPNLRTLCLLLQFLTHPRLGTLWVK